MGNDYVERERKSNIDINERRRLLRTKQSNEMNPLDKASNSRFNNLFRITELERQISDEAHWSRWRLRSLKTPMENFDKQPNTTSYIYYLLLFVLYK